MTKTVLITGASSGLGQASAQIFARNGWNVVATMRSPEKDRVLSGLDNVLVTRLDVEDAASIEAAIAAGIDRFGGIDMLVNNAGYISFGVFETMPANKVREQFDVNVFGLMDVTRAVLPHFRARGSGTIVNVSSGGGVFTLPLLSTYNASKFAIEGFSETLAYEVGGLGITVKLIEPGTIRTEAEARMMGEAGLNRHIADYDPFTDHMMGIYNGMLAGEVPGPDIVAERLYAAATDGTDRLRYVVGDDIQPFIQARREKSDQDYVAFMRSQFTLAA